MFAEATHLGLQRRVGRDAELEGLGLGARQLAQDVLDHQLFVRAIAVRRVRHSIRSPRACLRLRSPRRAQLFTVPSEASRSAAISDCVSPR